VASFVANLPHSWQNIHRFFGPVVECLLAAGADPNSYLDSAGSATYVASTPEPRALLTKHGGALDPYDLVWLGDDEEAVRRIAAEPRSAHAGCGGVLAAAATMGKRKLLIWLLEAGARVPPVVNDCRTYLFTDPEMLRLLLESGMDPNLPSWLHTTPLHDLCARDSRGRPREHRLECATILLDAGSAISAKDDDYRSTPLACRETKSLGRSFPAAGGIHEAFVDVNEEGTEAAAVTGHVGGNAPGPVPQRLVFRADHPFLFLIQDNRTGAILFLGRVMSPNG
jgi:hypothetical protein